MSTTFPPELELFSSAHWRILWLGRIAYAPALARQEALVAAKLRDPEHTPDTLLLLEHEPVYTIGRTPDRSSLGSAAPLPYPVETIHRGGQATYHGPGQLIGYPILDLTRRVRDLHRYLRALEEVLIRALAVYGIPGQRREGLTGVWVGEQKIASIGVGVRRWITLHGFALNVSGGEALTPFGAITPCGLSNVTMTSAEDQASRPIPVETVARLISGYFSATIDAQLPTLSPAGQAGPGLTVARSITG
jgi:lipoyl(octanoyl) transferase